METSAITMYLSQSKHCDVEVQYSWKNNLKSYNVDRISKFMSVADMECVPSIICFMFVSPTPISTMLKNILYECVSAIVDDNHRFHFKHHHHFCFLQVQRKEEEDLKYFLLNQATADLIKDEAYRLIIARPI